MQLLDQNIKIRATIQAVQKIAGHGRIARKQGLVGVLHALFLPGLDLLQTVCQCRVLVKGKRLVSL